MLTLQITTRHKLAKIIVQAAVGQLGATQAGDKAAARLPASTEQWRNIDAIWVYLCALWLVCTTHAASLLLDLLSGTSTLSLPILAGGVQARVDRMGMAFFMSTLRFALLFNAPGFYSIHPFENRICSADARAILFVFCFCVARLVTEKS
jgi:hypothetical protein